MGQLNYCCSFFFVQALLNVGEVEKGADPVAKQPPSRETAGTCGCKKPCNCNKAAVVFSDLYSTGTEAAAQIWPLISLTKGLVLERGVQKKMLPII